MATEKELRALYDFGLERTSPPTLAVLRATEKLASSRKLSKNTRDIWRGVSVLVGLYGYLQIGQGVVDYYRSLPSQATPQYPQYSIVSGRFLLPLRENT